MKKLISYSVKLFDQNYLSFRMVQKEISHLIYDGALKCLLIYKERYETWTKTS